MTTRWNEIAQSLRAQIENGELRPGDRLPNESDIASQWQVCRMTAHRAMTELKRSGLVERKRHAGTTVRANPGLSRPGQSTRRRVAMLIYHPNDYPQADYIHGFRSHLTDDCDLLLCDTRHSPEREEMYLQRLKEEADAVCCFPTGDPLTTRLLMEMADSGRPVICLDRIPDGANVDAVVTDNYAATCDGLRALQSRGHRRIAFFSADTTLVSAIREREQAFLDTLHSAGIEEPEALVRRFPPFLGYQYNVFQEVLFNALSGLIRGDSGPAPTALFCLGDYYMVAAIRAAERLGLMLPRDLEILSFSDCPPLVPHLDRSVHRISQRACEMGRIASQRLQRRLAGQESGPGQIMRVAADFHPAAVPETTAAHGMVAAATVVPTH